MLYYGAATTQIAWYGHCGLLSGSLVNIFFRNGPLVDSSPSFCVMDRVLAVSHDVTMPLFPAWFNSGSGVLQRTALVKIDSPLPLMVFGTCCLLILSLSLFFAFLLPEPVFTATVLALWQCWVLATSSHP